MIRPALNTGTVPSFIIEEDIGPLATRYHFWSLVLIASPGTTMAVTDPLAGQLQMTRSTTLEESANSRMLPNTCVVEEALLGTSTMRSRSLTSCFFEDVDPGGSVHARTKVTGIVDPLMHEIVNADAPDDVKNVSDVKNILWAPLGMVTASSRTGIPKPAKRSANVLERKKTIQEGQSGNRTWDIG